MKHSASDEARERDKTRKKLKRAIEREEKKLQDIGLKPAEIERNNNLKNMKDLLAKSYYDKKKNTYIKSHEAIADSVESFTFYQQSKKLKRETGESEGDYWQRQNKMFERNINQATLKEGISTLSGEDVHMFYKTTQSAWHKDTGTSMKNISILRATGAQDLKEVYNALMNPDKKNKELTIKYLEALGINVSFEDYVAALKEARKIAAAKYEPKLSDTGTVKESAEAVRYSSYISFWSSYLDSVKG